MRLILCIFLQLFCLQMAIATAGVTLRFVPTYAGKPIVLEEKYYPLSGGDSVMFETFKAYISDVAVYKNDKKVGAENNSYHLLNAADEATMSFVVYVSDSEPFNSIHFNLGVDSATSTSGALGGDLDPAKGMFWTWQSGYINCKIEGRSNLCKTRHNQFELHLGGYTQPHNSLQQLTLQLTVPDSDTADIVIEIPLDKFLSQVDLRKENAIMSPGKDAVVLAHKLASVFEVKK
jgi:hypothetical protein